MSAAFKTALQSTHKFVFVALCDNANDQGECYPSIPMLAQKTSLSERAVQKSITYLCETGFIHREVRTGRSTYYSVFVPSSWPTTTEPRSPRTTFTPNNVHPTPEQCAPPPPNNVHPTPERGSPITIIEPSIEPSTEPKATPTALPDWIPKEAWDGYLQMRKKIKKAPTERAIKLVVDQLTALRQAGHDPAAVLDNSTLNNWTDVYPIRDKNRRATDSKAEQAKSRHSGFENIDYNEGVKDGRII